MTDSATILVVEDNPSTLKMVRVALEGEGYVVVEARDAHSALTAVQRKVPDLVLQDLVLPDMDGLELVQRLRALAGSEMPILALSGLFSRPDESRMAGSAFTALLVKPIEPSRLAETVRAYLPQRREPTVEHAAGPRLLIVDDDPVQLKLARVHFRLLGFDVTTATGAAEALVAARARPPDVVLSDVFMPDIDGFQLCLDFRRDPRLMQVPIVLMSAQYGLQADQDLGRRVGANALVVRTHDFAAALAAINDAHRSGARRVAEEPDDQLQLKHAKRVIQQMERQVAATTGLAQRCALQATQLSVLSNIAHALTQHTDIDVALRDVLAVTLDAAGISKGALLLRDPDGHMRLRQDVGFSDLERDKLREFFGHLSWLDEFVARTSVVTMPSTGVPEEVSSAVRAGANVAAAQIVPLISDGRGVGAMFIGATRTDVTGEDSIAFAQTVGNQVVQSLELTRLVDRLTASEERYRTLLESANDAIAVLTPRGVIRELNRRWMTIIGGGHEQFIGRPIEELVPDTRGRWTTGRDGQRRTVDVERTWSADVTRPDGSIVRVEFSDTPVDIGGERLVLTIGRDVTQQQQLERQLRLAQRLEAVGHLAGGIAHDFNNVLTAILGYCELLLDDLDPMNREESELLEIKKAAQRASALTAQLLAFSRQQVLQPKVIDVNALIAEITPMLQRLIFEHSKIVVVPKADLGLVSVDPTQLEQILVNLVVNASDAMPRGGTITIETTDAMIDEGAPHQHLPMPPGDYVMLAVSDTGVGMDEATTQRVFDPFFTTKELGKGTGLGLATVYGIVKQSGGYIWVYSEVDHGTTFKVYLPRVTAEAPGVVARTATALEVPTGSETVLLVEDEESVRKVVERTLASGGYHVLAARHPKEAFALAREFDGPIHLLLSDVIMPESEGVPLYDRLAPMRPGLRVLYISGYANEAIQQRGLFEHGAAFLEKPFTPEALRRKVREVLDALTGET